MPLPIICETPPRRVMRMEKPAETSAIVPASSGSASRAWKCNWCRMAEKPDRSSSAMNAGKDQIEKVSGRAKLSCTHPTVRSVGSRIVLASSGSWSGRIARASSSVQTPPPSVARAASMRESSRSFAVNRNTLTSFAARRLPRSVTARACRMATPWGSSSRSACRSQSCPPASARGPPPERRNALSSPSARASSAEDNGLSRAAAQAPSSTAASRGAVRNCHADTPAARTTTSSDERVSRQKARMPPSSTAKGRICMAANGSRNAAISATTLNVASGRVADRRSSSIRSNRATSPARPASTAST